MPRGSRGRGSGAPCLSPGARENGTTSDGHGTNAMPCLHARGARPPPPLAWGVAKDCRFRGDGLCFCVCCEKSFSTIKHSTKRCGIQKSWRGNCVFQYCAGRITVVNTGFTRNPGRCRRTNPDAASRPASPQPDSGNPTQYHKAQRLVRLHMCADPHDSAVIGWKNSTGTGRGA